MRGDWVERRRQRYGNAAWFLDQSFIAAGRAQRATPILEPRMAEATKTLHKAGRLISNRILSEVSPQYLSELEEVGPARYGRTASTLERTALDETAGWNYGD